MGSRSDRAKPLSREDRRAAIIAATLPLLLEHGRAITTKQVAQAAGVAEGTIYSVFTDKEELVSASVAHHLAAATMRGALAELPDGLALPDLVDAVIELTRRRITETFALLSAVGFGRPGGEGGKHREPPDQGPVLDAIADLLLPHRDALRVPPRRAAEYISLAAFAMTHPMLTRGHPYPVEEIRALLLHGFSTGAPDSVPAAASAPLESLA